MKKQNSEIVLNVYGGLGVVISAILESKSSETENFWVGHDPKVQSSYRVRDRKTGITRIGYPIVSHGDYEQHYNIACKGTWWPVCHGLMTSSLFTDDNSIVQKAFEAHDRVQQKLAEQIFIDLRQDSKVLVHDYHLTGVARALRELGFDGKIGFYLHIPFPKPKDFWEMPNPVNILQNLCFFDFLGFQTKERDLYNFIWTLKDAAKEKRIFNLQWPKENTVIVNGRKIIFGNYPTRILPKKVESLAAANDRNPNVLNLLAACKGKRKLIVTGGRFDYTKGFFENLLGLQKLLQEIPSLAEEIYVFMVMQPTKYHLESYSNYQQKTLQLADSLAKDYPDTFCFHCLGLPREEWLAIMRKADVGLITPIADGQNLTAQEFIIVQAPENPGVLVISKGAGFSEELLPLEDGIIVSDPRNIDEMKKAILKGIKFTQQRAKNINKIQRKVIEDYSAIDFGKDLSQSLQ